MLGVGGGVGIGIGVFGSNDEIDPTPEEPPVGTPTAAPGTPTAAPTVTPGNPTASPTATSVADIIKEASASITPSSAFNDPESVQSKALAWLESNKNLMFYTAEKKVIRWVLAVFYLSTGGDNWTLNTNWMSDFDECTWYTAGNAPACNKDKVFALLDFGANKLQGPLPAELAILSDSIVSINIRGESSGRLTGEIPTEIGLLRSLTDLNLEGNSLVGNIPSSFSNLDSVVELNLSGNSLSGSLNGSTLAGMKSLLAVNLANNKFSGNLPTALTSMTNLESLNLEGNEFGGTLPAVFNRMSGLLVLNLNNNQLDDQIPKDIVQLTSLQEFCIHGNSFDGTIHTEMGLMRGLKKLDLGDNNFNFAIPSELGRLRRLNSVLDVSDNNLIGAVPSELGDLTGLRFLRLNGNNLFGELPGELSALSNLRVLRIDENDLQGSVPVCGSTATYADCAEIECECCTHCCADDDGEETCECQAGFSPSVCVEA